MPQFRATKLFCHGKCRQLAYRLRNGLPLSWRPGQTTKKIEPKEIQGDLFTMQMVSTDKGLRKIIVNKTTGDLLVFSVENGQDRLIK